jgi:hypothetical protein
MQSISINYLLTYDSYGPVHNRFHRGRMHYLGQCGGGGPGHSWAQMALASLDAIYVQFLYSVFCTVCCEFACLSFAAAHSCVGKVRIWGGEEGEPTSPTHSTLFTAAVKVPLWVGGVGE